MQELFIEQHRRVDQHHEGLTRLLPPCIGRRVCVCSRHKDNERSILAFIERENVKLCDVFTGAEFSEAPSKHCIHRASFPSAPRFAASCHPLTPGLPGESLIAAHRLPAYVARFPFS
jgi:hypothetical protein